MSTRAALSPYRILDLTTERGWLAGKILADLGAQVTKVEPPGGDPGRLKPPFAGGQAAPDTGLRWLAYNRGKRSITLDLAQAGGRELFLKLAARADAVLESFNPGQMEAWGLGPAELHAINSRLVLTRITPFGQTGPYADYAASDLILSAIGGAAWLSGELDRAPVRVTAPQYFLHASAEAAAHTAVGLTHAAVTGQGQQMDVSAQSTTVRTLMNAVAFAAEGTLLRREPLGNPERDIPARSLFACADGYVIAFFTFGPGLVGFRSWARAQGDPIPENFEAFSDEELARGQALYADHPGLAATLTTFFEGFIGRRTRRELLDEAMRRHLLISVINNLPDVLEDDQLADRGYFQPVADRRGGVARYPTRWAHLTATPLLDTAAAPTVGEHNEDVWLDEAELGRTALDRAVAEGVV